MILHVKTGSVLKMILASVLMHSVVQHAAHQVRVHVMHIHAYFGKNILCQMKYNLLKTASFFVFFLVKCNIFIQQSNLYWTAFKIIFSIFTIFLQFTQHVIGMYVKMVEPADSMYYHMGVNVLRDSLDRSVRIVSIYMNVTL